MKRWLRRPPGVGAALDAALERRGVWSADEMATWVDRSLSARLEVARSVPAYRAVSGSLLSDFPLLDRAGLGAAPNSFVDPRWPLPLLRQARTSGTSGEPIAVLRDPLSMWMEEAFLRRQLRRYGLTTGTPALAVRGEGPRDPETAPIGRSATRDEWVLAASRLDDSAVRALAAHGARHRVQLLRGYPSALLEVARRVQGLGLLPALTRWPLRLVHVSSETLSLEDEATLTEVFGVPVAEQYGHAERAVLIQSCPGGSRHLMTDYGWGEVQGGEWVGTGLFGAQVLVRYRTGDDAGEFPGGESIRPPSSCGCGWPFPVVERVQGRLDAVVVTPDGRRIGRLGPALRAVPGVARVQVEQRDDRVLVVRFEAVGDARAVGRALEASLRDLLRAPSMRLEMRPGVAPLRGASGKTRAVVSTCAGRSA